ncbi:MAG: amino acid-binding protein [Methermicoccaceae archaeon]
MRLTLDLELKDVPGELVRALMPFSEHGANILSVLHYRDRGTPRGTVPVQVVCELADGDVSGLVSSIEAAGITIASMGTERLVEEGAVMLIGHIVHSDLKDTIGRIDSTGFAEVVSLRLSMPAIDEPSSAYLVIRAKSKEHLSRALQVLREVAMGKDILVIESI